jgi:Zn-dependent protease
MSWKLGRVAGIDVYLHPTFLFVLMFPQVTGGGLFGLAVVLAGFGCVLLHELGHALMARRFGIGTQDITLYPIGGVARLTRMPRSPGAELLIALAGPAVNLAIVGGLIGLDLLGAIDPWQGSLPGLFAYNLLIVNLVLALFNLIPAFPMDGGRVLRALLSAPLGRVRATAIAAGLGRGLALLFGIYCLLNGLWVQVFLAWFIYLAAGTELAGVVAEERRRMYGGAEGIWTAPPGYCWVRRGNGAWQLAPVVLNAHEATSPRWP